MALVSGKRKKPSEALKQAALSVLVARASVCTLRPICEALQGQVMTEKQYFISEENKDMATPEEIAAPLTYADAYLGSREDWAEQQASYYKLFTEAGLTVDDPQKCPLLVAEGLQREAERALILASAELSDFPIDRVELWTSQGKQYLELTLKYVSQFIGPVKLASALKA